MQTSSDTKEVFQALANFQDEVGTIPKGDDNPFFKSKYAGLPTVVARAQPILRKHGLVVVQTIEAGALVTRVAHSSGQFFESSSYLHLGDKDTAQAYGSAVTYARRYDYVTALGLICDEDDDGNQASLNDTTSSRTPTTDGGPRQRRTRRTKAEMEAAKAEADADAVSPPEDLPPVPEGWDNDREACILAHNSLAERIAALNPEQVAECVTVRNVKGWPMTKTDFLELAAQVTVFEQFGPTPEA